MKFELVEVTTKDRLVHQGIYFEPKKKGTRAILWVHGLTGRFYGDPKLMNLFAKHCENEGIGFAAFNNRGHDIVTNIHKITDEGVTDRVMLGAGLENFDDSHFDIDAGVSFLMSRGYEHVFIVGHSTGANKACYFAATKNNPLIAGVVLAGPMSDRLSARNEHENTKQLLALAQEKIRAGRGEELEIFPNFFPATPRRIVSLLEANSTEDVFTYGDTSSPLSMYSNITVPLLVVFSENDETADRPIEEIQKFFDAHTKSPKYKCVVIADTTHGYDGKEKEFVETIVEWVGGV